MYAAVIKRVFVGLAMVALSTASAVAGVEQVAEDFKPLAGYVVMERQGEYIIDLDASRGVRVGDLFVASIPGEKIVHPVTGEVLGSLDEVRAQLKVSKVLEGYSFAVPLPGSSPLEKGTEIKRFQGIPATFWDYTGTGAGLFAELKNGLPHLVWRDYASAQAQRPKQPKVVGGVDGLLFILNDQQLEVRDAALEPLRVYRRDELAPTEKADALGPAAVPTGIVAVREPRDSGGGGIIKEMPRTEGIWFSPEIPGEIVGLEAADLDGDGRLEMALAFSDEVVISRIDAGNYTEVWRFDIPKRARVLGVDAADLDRDGQLELYLSAVEADGLAETVSSLVAEPVDGEWQIMAKDIPYFLGGIELPGEGRVVLAQRGDDRERTYSGWVYRLERDGDTFRAGEKFALNFDELTVHGFTPFKAGDREMVALFDINDDLKVLENDGTQMWASGDPMGGSQLFIAHPDPNGRSAEPVHQFLKARVGRLDDGTLLVPMNEGSSRRFSTREFSRSRLLGMRWDGYGLKEVWHTEPQGGYLADFRVADADNDGKNEIVMAVLFSQGGFLKANKKRSALLVYELP